MAGLGREEGTPTVMRFGCAALRHGSSTFAQAGPRVVRRDPMLPNNNARNLDGVLMQDPYIAPP
jgi:hypothetical protein